MPRESHVSRRRQVDVHRGQHVPPGDHVLVDAVDQRAVQIERRVTYLIFRYHACMRTMTATEASRHFSDLLDAVERGETVIIFRGSHPVAEIGPAHRRTGADLRIALTGTPPPDEDFRQEYLGSPGHGDLGGARSMGRRLILDTNILIAYERGTLDRSTLDDDELAIGSITVAEYRTGIELADTPERGSRAGAGTGDDHLGYRRAGLHPGHCGAPRAAARARPQIRPPTRRARPDHRRARRRDRPPPAD